jgi:hypothetical protein
MPSTWTCSRTRQRERVDHKYLKNAGGESTWGALIMIQINIVVAHGNNRSRDAVASWTWHGLRLKTGKCKHDGGTEANLVGTCSPIGSQRTGGVDGRNVRCCGDYGCYHSTASVPSCRSPWCCGERVMKSTAVP